MSIQDLSADELFRRSFEREVVTNDTDFYLKTALSNVRQTAFQDLIIANRTTTFSVKPTWGLSDLRDRIEVDGSTLRASGVSTSAIREVDGEFEFNSGTGTGTVRSVQTIDRGQYLAGNEGEAGIGIRIPVLPASGSTHFIRFGYYDGTNGFGAGVDGDGTFLFRYTDGEETEKVYQSDWNVDKLDGNDGTGNPSNLVLNFANGSIFKMFFTWYGYGTIRFYFSIRDGSGFKRLFEAHRMNVDESVSIADPNQPIKMEIGNGNTSTTNLKAYCGGRQFSIIGTRGTSERRLYNASISGYTISADGWIPVVCLRKKDTFGTSNRTNSLMVSLLGFECQADAAAEFKIGYRAVTSGGTYAAPTSVPATETGVETKIQSGSTISASDEGIRVLFGFVSGTKQTPTIGQREDRLTIGRGFETVLFARRTASNVSPIITAQILWEEEW